MLAISVRYVRLSSDSALQPFFQIWMFWSLSLCTWNDQPKSASCGETDQSWSAALLHFDHFESNCQKTLKKNTMKIPCIFMYWSFFSIYFPFRLQCNQKCNLSKSAPDATSKPGGDTNSRCTANCNGTSSAKAIGHVSSFLGAVVILLR